MPEKPILFSTPMVRAVLAGTKTVTRRLIKPQPDHCHRDIIGKPKPWSSADYERLIPQAGDREIKPRYQPGDILRVNEVWRTWKEWDDHKPSEIPEGQPIFYDTDESEQERKAYGRYRQARYMCAWMSRPERFEVLDSRPEGVQDITEEDAIREGITGDEALVGQVANPFRTAFAILWDSIHGAGAWAANPFVWRISFRRLNA